MCQKKQKPQKSEIMKISEKDVNKMLDSNKLEIDENAEK